MMDVHRSFDHLIGLRLTEARRSLQEDTSCALWPLEIVETAPPQAPQRPARATPRKAKEEATNRPARAEKQLASGECCAVLYRNPLGPMICPAFNSLWRAKS
jgi:hypothetical protein